ncbi:MAG: rhodanese-like domain-containing protein [Planctomycetes bacterium]|nr:rhodanese-like domain-containing protein [Planctomycetota bacterium]MCC7168881.1 rhodanese-like domain-containing protein [Planctomycetota bacterium]
MDVVYPFAGLGLIALVVAVRARSAARQLESKARELESGINRAESRAVDAEQRTARLEQFVRMLADGKPVTGAMIEEGRLFDEIDAEQCRVLVEESQVLARGDTLVVDVRTQGEVEGGHIAGARWIPIDQLEGRYRELPKDKRLLVVCAAGGRSAAACDFLSGKGYEKLANVVGGMSSYRGKTERGVPAAKT